ncbi:hypothetical protein EU78_10180 [Mycolicibacterium rufum]|nr:hypothetical protein EU78_10180 [Mycolicibacterium rufum]
MRAASSALLGRRRWGMVAVRCGSGGGVGGGGGRAAVVAGKVGKNRVQPGRVISVRPSGLVKMMVASGDCCSRQPSVKVLLRWWVRHLQFRFDGWVGP